MLSGVHPSGSQYPSLEISWLYEVTPEWKEGGHCLIGYPYPGSPWVAWQERLERGRFLEDPVGRVVGVLEPATTPGCEHDAGSIGPMRRLGCTRTGPGGKR